MIFLGAQFYTDSKRVHEIYMRTLEVYQAQRGYAGDYPLPDMVNGTLFLDANLPSFRIAFHEVRRMLEEAGRPTGFGAFTVVHQGGVLRGYSGVEQLGEDFFVTEPVYWTLPERVVSV